MLRTNPLTVGFPTDEEFPFVLDCAAVSHSEGKSNTMPEPVGYSKGMVIGWWYRHDGQQANLSDLTKEQLWLTLGGIGEELAGYKGYGYATVVEIYLLPCRPEVTLSYQWNQWNWWKVPYHLGHFFLAIDRRLLGLDSFKKTTGDILRALRSSKRAPGEDRIYTAGEKEYLCWLDRKDKGVPIGESVQKEFIRIRDQFDLPFHFPFED